MWAIRRDCRQLTTNSGTCDRQHTENRHGCRADLKQMRHVVAVGDMKLGRDADLIVTHALGSCLGLVVYDPVEILKTLPSPHFKKYFNQISGQPSGSCRIVDEVRQMVRLAWLNLLESWPMKGPFNVIFCRNVMIYFDRPTQQRLINRFWQMLEPGGFLFVGHSEGLSAINHKCRYMRPATYRK